MTGQEGLRRTLTLVPAGLSPQLQPVAHGIGAAARSLYMLRERWLNPPEWVTFVPDVTPLGLTTSPYPERPIAKPGHETALAKRTLTNLYNEMPVWLSKAHDVVDAAVAAAYGWPDYAPGVDDEEIFRRLLKLSDDRHTAGKTAVKKPSK